jgi:putative colanic acid biosynthesis UDP-glucose lipid carrier transferase
MVHRYTTFIKAINLTIDYIILNLSMIIAYFVEDNAHFCFGQIIIICQ